MQQPQGIPPVPERLAEKPGLNNWARGRACLREPPRWVGKFVAFVRKKRSDCLDCASE